MIDEDKAMQEEYERSESQRAWDENERLRRENERLKSENKRLERELTQQLDPLSVARLSEINEQLRRELNEAYETIKANNYQLGIHRQRIAKLEAELNSANVKIGNLAINGRDNEQLKYDLQLAKQIADQNYRNACIYQERIAELEAELEKARQETEYMAIQLGRGIQ